MGISHTPEAFLFASWFIALFTICCPQILLPQMECHLSWTSCSDFWMLIPSLVNIMFHNYNLFMLVHHDTAVELFQDLIWLVTSSFHSYFCSFVWLTKYPYFLLFQIVCFPTFFLSFSIFPQCALKCRSLNLFWTSALHVYFPQYVWVYISLGLNAF